jgi:DNA mismatch repair protein MutL
MSGASIHVLPPDVAGQIAAGEVVERPVSVVRELLDNAIDAGATRIDIEVNDGGLSLISITDDGHGIPPEQIELAFERHATSKIAVMDDLGHVQTLGFRGEALPSIAAAGDVELTTRAATEPVGVHAVFVNVEVVRRTARPAPVGTSFAVRDLFARLPARRKFLHSPQAEARQVSVLVSHYALAYPGIAFHLTQNGRRALSTSGDGGLRHAFAAIHGPERAAAMLDVDACDGPVHVTGLVGPPSVHRGNRAAISVFVNGRWVQSRPLTFAIVDAYQAQLPVGRHPVAALSIELPEEDVDVNVHPAKAEVRFRDERGVARAVRRAASNALEQSRPVDWTPAASWPTGSHPAPSIPAASAGDALLAPEPLQARLELVRSPERALLPPSDTAGTPTQREVLPLLRVVGQLAVTYIVAEGPDGMYLIDQHAAHERVVYDRIAAARAKAEPSASQPLLEPAMLDLDIHQAVTLEEHREQLAALGLDVEPFGERSYLLRAVPVGIAGTDLAGAVRGVLDKLGGERRVNDPFARAAATVACHSSVRAGMALAMDELRKLAEDLEATESPRTCPHGRPTLIHMGTELIERQFGRR